MVAEAEPVLPSIVSVCVSNRKGPAIKREPSGETERIARIPVTFRLRKTELEATSYTKRRVLDIPIIRLPFAAVTSPARNPARFVVPTGGSPAGVGAGGVTGMGKT